VTYEKGGKRITYASTAIGAVVLFVAALAGRHFALAAPLPTTVFETKTQTAAEILQLKDTIDAKKDQIDDLQKQIEGYNRKITDTQSKTATLENDISLIENKIAKTALDIERTQKEMEAVSLEMKSLDLQVQDKTERIAEQKEIIAEYLRTLERYDNRGALEVLLANDSFSEFFDQVKYLENVEGDIGKTTEDLVALKAHLEKERTEKEAKKTVLKELQTRLDNTRDTLADAKNAKETLADAAKQSEESLRKSLQQLRNEQANIDADLSDIQARLKDKLRENDRFANLPDNVILSWPVDPGRGITAYFHDPEYPFRYVFEHPGVDVRAYQGIPVHAAASGFVARAHDGGTGYSYVMIIHPGGISTVYGHLSKILVVEDQFVERGAVIGNSGGAPGTHGAGRMTTGPHLHFEVRSNGIPVNPLDYLLK
jgi:murein DD-endopeptidase MepM/ murein hydrolase activator NlpD